MNRGQQANSRKAKILLPLGVLLMVGCALETGDDVSAQAQDVTSTSCVDQYELRISPDNDAVERAIVLPTVSDDDSTLQTTDEGASIADIDDVDWYRFEALDESTKGLAPLIRLNALPAGSAYRDQQNFELCGFVERSADDIECLLGQPISDHGMSGCCAEVANIRGMDMYILQLNLDTSWGDDSARVFVRVRSTGETADGACYRLAYTG